MKKNLTCIVQFQEKRKTDNTNNNNNNKTCCDVASPLLQSNASYTLRIVYVLGSLHTNAFSKVCVSVAIENASIDIYSRPRYCFDAFPTD